MTATTDKDKDKIAEQDLDLLDEHLEDEGKSDSAIWDEIEETEADAGTGAAADDDEALAAADGAATDAGAEKKPDATDKLGDEGQSLDDESGGKAPDKQAADQDDPWATATDEQRSAHEADQKRIKKLEQSDRSQRGRLGAMQRQINDTAAKPAPAKTTAADEAAGDDEGEGAADGLYGSDEWKAHEKEYPEISGPNKTITNNLADRIDVLEEKQGVSETVHRQEAVDQQTEVLDGEHSDWEEVMAAEGTLEWLQDQPRHIQEAARRNSEEIVDAAEAADVIGRLKAFRSAQDEAGEGAGDADANGAGADDGAGDGKPQLTGKRKRQLEAASTTRAGGPGAAHGIPEDGDPEAIWAAYDKQDERDAQRA